MGGGESWDGFAARVQAAVADLVARTPAGSRVLVLTHGGNVHAALGTGLRFPEERRRWPLERVRNASVTEAILTPERFHLQVYNDARHAMPSPVGPDTIALYRHAETVANTEGRWHGHTDGPLSDTGRSQAARLAETTAAVDRVYASPLERTRETATAYARRHGLEVVLDRDLIEIDFAAWEGLTTSGIEGAFPDEFARVFERFEDLPRGSTGETFAGAGRRLARAVERIDATHPGERIAVFTHGGVIWALVARILGFGWERYHDIAIPTNAGLTHVEVTGEGMRLVDYNLPLR